MQITNGELIKLNTSLQSIRKKKLPISISFIIAKNMKKIDSAVQDYESARSGLLDKYGEKDSKGNPVIQNVEGQQRVKILNFTDFNKEFDELNNISIELSLDSFSMDVLNTLETNPTCDQLTVEELEALSIMITETEVV